MKPDIKSLSLRSSMLILVLTVNCGRPAPPKYVGSSASRTEEVIRGSNKKGAANATPETDSIKKSVVNNLLLDTYDCKAESQTGKALLRLLTKDEYQNTVRDALGVKLDYRANLPQEIGAEGYHNNADVGVVTDSHVASYMDTAISIAGEIIPNLKGIVGCDAIEKEVCVKKVVETLAPILWRRPLTAIENKGLMDFYTAVSLADPNEAVTAVLVNLLTSPNFLYRSETGQAGKLTAYELSSALSYFFWGTIPDKSLAAVAQDGSILEESTLVAQANRLFVDPRSQYLLRNFSNDWLGYKRVEGITKDPTLYPQWKPEIQTAMALEAEQTFDYIVRQPSGSFEKLLTNDFSIGSPALAKFYNAESVKQGNLDTIKFDGKSRRGILGFGAILSSLATPLETNAFKRGNFVQQRLLCNVPDPIPDNEVFALPAPDKNLTTRERFAQHSASPSCKGCHVKIDGIGLGMEDFNAIGLFRATDNGKAVDSLGELIDATGGTKAFTGTSDLGGVIADSNQAKRCFAIQLHRYTFGHIERQQDVCAIRDIAETFKDDSLTLRELIIKMVTHNSFLSKGK